MIVFKKVMVEDSKMVGIVCDVCNTSYKSNNSEIDEFIHVSYTGGYFSVFGDGANVRLDMCQHCFKNLLGNYIQKDSQ